MKSGSAEVDEQGVGDAGSAEIVDDLRPLDPREGLHGLQLDDEPALKAREVRPPDGREWLAVVADAGRSAQFCGRRGRGLRLLGRPDAAPRVPYAPRPPAPFLPTVIRILSVFYFASYAPPMRGVC